MNKGCCVTSITGNREKLIDPFFVIISTIMRLLIKHIVI